MSNDPQPSPSPTQPVASGGVPQEEIGQATLVWVLSIFFGFIPGLIFYLVAKDKPFVHRHAAMALGLTITALIGYVISGVLMIILIGILTYIAVFIFSIVVCIMGAIAANKGNAYDPPIVAGLTKSMFKIA